MKLNRKLVLILSLVLSLALATGGTLAYLSDTDADVNTMTLGNVYIVQNEQQRDENGELEPFENNKAAYPAVGPVEWAGEGVELNGTKYLVFTDELKNVIDKFVTVTNTGNSDAYVRTIVAIEAPDYDPNDLIHVNVSKDGLTQDPAWAPVEIDGVKYVYSVFTYTDALAAKATSQPSLMQLFLDSKATNADVAKFGDTWEVLVLSQAVQTAGFDDAKTALDTAFNEANAENVKGWFNGWSDWTEGEEIGSPGDKNDTNNPPVDYTGDPAELAKLLTEATDAGSGNVTIKLEESYDMTGIDWTPIRVDGYHGADVVTVEGNGNIIKGLNAPLFAGGFAGESGIIIKDLTIADSVMTAPTSQGSGAFICCVDSMETIVLENCHAKNVTLNGESRTGGLIGWTSGYSNVNDGPVKTYVTLTNCTVEGCTINAGTQSAGGLIGHSGASDWTYTTVTGCKVIDTEINGGSDRTGVYVGTANVGETTFTGCSYEDVTGTLNEAHVLYGRFVPGSTGKLTIDGVEIK